MGLAFLLDGCTGPQSTLNAESPGTRAIENMWWIMFWTGCGILAVVMVLALWAVFVAPERRPKLGEWPLVIVGGLVFPVVALTALLVYGVTISATLVEPSPRDALPIRVVGNMWWWEVVYPGNGTEEGFVTANEIHVPIGRPVEVTVATTDVIHSFWIPSLVRKIDMIPGHENRVRFTAEAAGVFRGQCAEFCGAQHARMAFFVVAQTPQEFAEWQAQQRRAAAQPEEQFLVQGFRAFFKNGCHTCHTIRGTPAQGKLGPDLTHVGSRLSLAAGILPNNRGTFAGWIADSQGLKPGNAMPSFGQLDGETLRALAAYLESLE